MTRRLSLAVVLTVFGGLLLATGAPGQIAAPSLVTVEPDTTIDSGPPNPSSSSTATFTFSSSEAGSTFECSRDGASFTNCSSPRTYNGLSDGSHTFEVRAINALSEVDSSPAQYGWTISTDSTAPETTINTGPSNPTSSTSATFTFSSSESGSTFECSRDGAAFTFCSSPKSYSGLADGVHTFRVRATDASDNTDASPDSYTWTIGTDSVAPETTITSGPIGTTSSTSATFTFASSEVGSTFECRRNLAAFVPCTSPATYSALADGTHSFEVRATDSADNTDPSPASATWTVASNTTGVPTVANLRAVAGNHRVRLVWTNPTGIGIQRIEIRRGIRLIRVYHNPVTTFVDTTVYNGRKYTYSIVVVDDLVQRSPATSVFAVPHGKLRAPGDGKAVRRAPMLRWMPRARATYYNVQVYRNGKKILSKWPARPRLQLKFRWQYQDRNYRLRDGRYVWYVFPGFGRRADNRYGKEWGHSLFIKR